MRRMNLILVAVILLGVGGSVSGCGGADARRASHIARGQKYLADGKLEKARIEFADALQIAPSDAQARYLSGRVSELLGDPRAAASMYQGAIDVNPAHLEARANLARLYLHFRSPDKALELIRPVLDKHPDDPKLLTVRAVARSQLKDNAGALSDAERAVQVAPSNEEAVSVLAGVYQGAGQPQRALELVRAAIARVPASVALHQLLARMYLSGGEDKLAEEQLLQVVQLAPKELAPRLQLAAFYAGANRLDEAERTFEAAMAALPGSEAAGLAYTEFLATSRSPAQGEAALKELIAHDPRNYDLQLRLGALQQRAGATQEASATYRAIIAADPAGAVGVAARDRIAAIDIVAGKDVDAKLLLAEALKNNPRDNDALTLRANMSLKEGDPLAAIADLRAVLRDQPQSVPILRTLARAHLANHEPTLAEENLRSALAAAPRDLGVRVDLGEFLTRTHRTDQAIALLEETVKATPDISGTAARTALIEAYMAKPDLATARAAAEDLKTLRPDLAIGSYLAGLIAREQKRLDDAQREFEHALQLQPAATDVLTALARLEFERGRHAQAIALVRSTVESRPGDAAAHDLLGQLYAADKDYAEAVTVLNEAVRLAPSWWLPYRNLAQAKLAAKDQAGALAIYEAGVNATEEPVLVTELAAIYEQQGRFENAIRQYEVLHQRSPHLELAANNLAILLVTYRHDQASLDRARDLTASFANSDVPALLDTRGWVMFKRGDVSEALSELQKASSAAPGARVILYHLGMAQLKAGLPEKARTSLEAALAGGASFSGTEEARLALVRLKARTG